MQPSTTQQPNDTRRASTFPQSGHSIRPPSKGHKREESRSDDGSGEHPISGPNRPSSPKRFKSCPNDNKPHKPIDTREDRSSHICQESVVTPVQTSAEDGPQEEGGEEGDGEGEGDGNPGNITPNLEPNVDTSLPPLTPPLIAEKNQEPIDNDLFDSLETTCSRRVSQMSGRKNSDAKSSGSVPQLSKLLSKEERKHKNAQKNLDDVSQVKSDNTPDAVKERALKQGWSVLGESRKGLKLRCGEGHKVLVRDISDAEDLRCLKCEKRYQACVAHAQAHNGRVKDSTFHSLVTFECALGHEWKVKYAGYLFKKWCSHCEKLRREEQKRLQAEEEKRQKAKFIEDQNALFEEARRKLQEQERREYVCYSDWFYRWPNDLYPVGYAQRLLTDDSINRLANEETLKYMAEREYHGLPNYEDLFFMYKVLITPAELLLAKLKAVPKAELPSFYRRHAITLHPDKNQHPRASEAFQRFNEFYKTCS